MLPNQQEVEFIVNQVFIQVKEAYRNSMLQHYFKSKAFRSSEYNKREGFTSFKVREHFAKTSVAAMSKFISSEIDHLSKLQNIDGRKVKAMFFVCIEKFLNDKGI
jgi:hypothetical protein